MAFFTLTMHCDLLGRLSSVSLLLPHQAPPPGGYPVLYLLHRMGGDHHTWSMDSALGRVLENLPCAIVMPDGDKGCYLNSKVADYEEILFEELPHKLRHKFHLTANPNHTFLAGNELGGFGALREGLLHPERYRQVFSMSPVIDLPSFLEEREESPGLKAMICEALASTKTDLYARLERMDSAKDAPAFFLYGEKDEAVWEWAEQAKKKLDISILKAEEAQECSADLFLKETLKRIAEAIKE